MARLVLLVLAVCAACAPLPSGQPGQASFDVLGATLYAPPGTDPHQLTATLQAGVQAVQPIGYPDLPSLTVYLEPARVSVYESGFDCRDIGDEVHAYIPDACLADSDLAHAIAHWLRYSITGDADGAHLDPRFWGYGGIADAIVSAQQQWCDTHQQ